jgi:hypothetical protein
MYFPISALVLQVVSSPQDFLTKILYALLIPPTHCTPFSTSHILRCVGDVFVLLVQVQAALEAATKKKLLDMPSVPKKASAGNNKKAG